MIRLGLGLLAFVTGANASELVALSGRAMGTNWTVKFLQPARPLEHDDVARRVAARLETLEQIFSTYRADSEISRFNARTGTEWVSTSADFAHVALEARAISELTHGAFDATVFPLVRLWGFASERRTNESLPTDDEIRAQRARVGWQNLQARMEPPALRKERGDLALDFSSIAKGFASDEIARLLRDLGAEHCFVQIAGDIACVGHAADGKPWRVGLEEPREDAQAIATVVALSDSAVSTSGNYRNFFRVGVRRYGHIIDPRTGVPVSTELTAVSVVHRLCARSSALATGLFVLGAEEGWRLAVRERMACVFFFERSNGILFRRMTPELERLLVETQLSSATHP